MNEDRRKQPDLATINGKMDLLMEQTARQNVALFAPDANNEFGTPGVMTSMQKMDKHINVVCNLGLLAKKILKFWFWFVTGAGGAAAAGKAAGWW